ncbi:hypothetical protein ASZ90_013086 [hydrocarbon metagenome]|uniref:Uncharacterized protein n=1 Tax=hydrocarbon metagenome TaxID=938273 RepID=A0A0W8F8P2_9ZZZZ
MQEILPTAKAPSEFSCRTSLHAPQGPEEGAIGAWFLS